MAAIIKTPERELNDYIPDIIVARPAAVKVWRFNHKIRYRGLGIFGSVIVAPDESISQMPCFFTAGVSCRGIFASCPTDSAGFGFVYGAFSRDLREAEERESQTDPTTEVQDHEAALEWTYRFYFRKGALFLQPDVQYVIRPGGTGKIDDSLILGCQVAVNF